QKASKSDPHSSESFDLWLQGLWWADLLETPAMLQDLNWVIQDDPFLAMNEPEVADFQAKINAYIVAPQPGPTYSMVEAALGLDRCVNVPFAPSCIDLPLQDSTEWRKFRSIYLAEKYRYQKRIANRKLRDICGLESGVNYY